MLSGRIVIVIVLLTMWSHSAARADDIADCEQSTNYELRVTACTSIIDNPATDIALKNAAQFKRGIAYYKLKQRAPAFKDLLSLSHVIDYSQVTLPYLAHLWEQEGKNEIALSTYDEAVAALPQNAAVLVGRANLRAAMNMRKEAIEDYSAAIKLDGKLAKAYLQRGLHQREVGNVDAAIADLTRAVELMPDSAAAHGGLGTAYLTKGDNDRAFVSLSKAIELDPRDAKILGNRGVAHVNKGNLTEALRDLSTAIALDPNNASNIQNRSIAHEKLGSLPRALNDMSAAIELRPGERSYYLRSADLQIRLKQYPWAVKDITKAIELGPEDAALYLSRGRIIVLSDGKRDPTTEETNAAIADFTRAIELQPDLWEAYERRGTQYFNLTKHDEQAIADLGMTLMLNPDNAQAKKLLDYLKVAPEQAMEKGLAASFAGTWWTTTAPTDSAPRREVELAITGLDGTTGNFKQTFKNFLRQYEESVTPDDVSGKVELFPDRVEFTPAGGAAKSVCKYQRTRQGLVLGDCPMAGTYARTPRGIAALRMAGAWQGVERDDQLKKGYLLRLKPDGSLRLLAYIEEDVDLTDGDQSAEWAVSEGHYAIDEDKMTLWLSPAKRHRQADWFKTDEPVRCTWSAEWSERGFMRMFTMKDCALKGGYAENLSAPDGWPDKPPEREAAVPIGSGGGFFLEP